MILYAWLLYAMILNDTEEYSPEVYKMKKKEIYKIIKNKFKSQRMYIFFKKFMPIDKQRMQNYLSCEFGIIHL